MKHHHYCQACGSGQAWQAVQRRGCWSTVGRGQAGSIIIIVLVVVVVNIIVIVMVTILVIVDDDVQRSATIVLAFLLQHEAMSLQDALKQVKIS